jgi:hypothetical protein
MTVLVLSRRHPFAGISRSRRCAPFTPAPANAGSASPTRPQSRGQIRHKRPIRGISGSQLLAILAKPSPPKAAAIPNPHKHSPLSRGFVLRRLSDAGPIPDRPLVLGPASETLPVSSHCHDDDRTRGVRTYCLEGAAE